MRLRTRVAVFLVGIVGAFGVVATPVALASPHATVSPRVRCGGFNGHIEWTGTVSVIPYIQVWGKVWSTCRSYTTLELSYEQGFSSATQEAGTTFGFGHDSEGVNYGAEDLGNAPVGHISVKVCSTYPSGRTVCGSPQSV
jgi:hypothetical protein